MRSSIAAMFCALLLCASSAWAGEVRVDAVSLPSGQEAWVIENHHIPTINVKMAFRDAGSSSDPTGQEGRAQLAAALLMEGAGDLNSLAFHQALETGAIKLGIAADGDLLTIEMQTLTEQADRAFELLGMALSSPRFDEEAIARIKREAHTALLQQEESPRYQANVALLKTAFGDHPYGRPPSGAHAGIDALTAASLKEYTHQYITQQNMIISVVGDITPDALKRLSVKYLSTIAQQKNLLPAVADAQVNATGQMELITKSIPQTIVMAISPGIKRDDADFYTAFVLNHLLGGGTLTSKLGDEIREKRGLAYYAYTQLMVQDHGAALVAACGTRNNQAAEALKVMMQTLRSTLEGKITDEELADAKGYITGAYPLTLASNDGLADTLMMMQRFRLGRDYIEKRNSLIEAVTKEDVLRVAKRLLTPDKIAVIAVGNPSPTLANFR